MATDTAPDAAALGGVEHVELPIGGMTCAACAARVERSLNGLAGVTASVNLVTERAVVAFDPRRASPGDLVHAVRAAGYDTALPAPTDGVGTATDGASTAVDVDVDLDLDRLRLSAALALPVVLLSMIPALQFNNWQWLALLLTTPVVVWGAEPFHRAALRSARHGTATMDTLVSAGVLTAYGWSVWALFLGDAGAAGMTMDVHWTLERSTTTDQLYLEVAAAVPVFMLVGRALEARARRQAGAALRALLALTPAEATLWEDGAERTVAASSVAVGQRVVVRPGQRVPTDGRVVEGHAAMDVAAITGESVPVEVGPGDAVVGATIATDGRLVVEATRVGADTTLAQMGRLVQEAQAGKARIARLADRVAGVFVPAVLVLAAATFGFWLGAGWPTATAVSTAVAVLVIACPCALGLATPTALLVGSGRGAQLGILIKGPEVLESTRRVDTIVLDKTGTVTTGVMAVVAVHAGDGGDPAEALGLAGALEDASEHPVARAVAAHARTASPDGTLPTVDRFRSHAGLGVEGVVAGRAVVVGTAAFVAERAGPAPDHLGDAAAAAEARGAVAVVVAVDGKTRAVLEVADTVRPTSAAAIAALRGLGLRPVLLTGDHEAAARVVAAEVGIDDVVAGVRPAGKVDAVRRLQEQGRVVAMVGDGVNDAPALAQADLGLALGSGTDAAIEASDLTLLRGDLPAVVDAVLLARRTLATIRGNLFWAFAYNVAALPLAAAGYLNPLIGAAAMAASSLLVVTNSLRLRSFRPHDELTPSALRTPPAAPAR